jgi:hypothetical protein
MDLRNRDNLSLLVDELRPYPEFAGLSKFRKSDEIENQIYSKLILNKNKISKITKIEKLNLNIFHSIHHSKFELRISAVSEKLIFSDIVDSVSIRLSPSNEIINWKRTEGTPLDGLTVVRPLGASPVTAEIKVNVNNRIYEIPGKLKREFKINFSNYSKLFKIICNYIKNQQLSSSDDPSYFTPDSLLHECLYPNHPTGHPVPFASLLEAIRTNIRLPGPIVLNHQIDSNPDNERIFEIFCEIEENIEINPKNEIQSKIENINSGINFKINELIGLIELNEINFINKFINNPIRFISEILKRPTGIVSGLTSDNLSFSKFIKTFEFYKQPWVNAAALHFVNEQRKGSDRQGW